MRRVQVSLIFMEIIDFGDTGELEVWFLRTLFLMHLEHTVQVRLIEDSEDPFRDPFEARANHLERI